MDPERRFKTVQEEHIALQVDLYSQDGIPVSTPHIYCVRRSYLEARDPEKTSFISSKLRFAGVKEFDGRTVPLTVGSEDCVFSEPLVRSVFAFIDSGSAACPFAVPLRDWLAALDFFGFDCDVTVSENDPQRVGKMIVPELRGCPSSAMGRRSTRVEASESMMKTFLPNDARA